MRISFGSEVASNAARSTINHRLPSRREKGPAEGDKIERFHEHIAKIRERIFEIRADKNIPSDAKADMVKELEENIHAIELEIEYLIQELKRKKEEGADAEIMLGCKKQSNRDVFEYVKSKNEETTVEGAMDEFLDDKEAQAAEAEAEAAQSAEDMGDGKIEFVAKDFEEEEQQQAEENGEPEEEEKKELPNFKLTGTPIPGIEKFAGDVGDIDKMKTVISETRKLERSISQIERQYLKNGNGAGKAAISKARGQIRSNRSLLSNR